MVGVEWSVYRFPQDQRPHERNHETRKTKEEWKHHIIQLQITLQITNSIVLESRWTHRPIKLN